jgi:hypothetical protein
LKSNLNRIENVCSRLTRPGKFHCSARRFPRPWGSQGSRAKFAILLLRRRKDLASCQRTRRGPRPRRIANRTEQNCASASPFSPAYLSIECLASRYCCYRRTVARHNHLCLGAWPQQTIPDNATAIWREYRDRLLDMAPPIVSYPVPRVAQKPGFLSRRPPTRYFYRRFYQRCAMNTIRFAFGAVDAPNQS